MSTTPHRTSPTAARFLAVGLLGFVFVAPAGLFEVDAITRSGVIAAVVASIVAIAVFAGQSFFRRLPPVPEALLAVGWLLFAFGWGYLPPSRDMQLAILLAVLAPVFAGACWVWSAVRLVATPRLQPFLSALAAQVSLFLFMWFLLQLGNTGGAV